MKLLEQIREDTQAALERDPAAESISDIVLYSVGTHAVWSYRWHHWLYEHGHKHLALWLSKRTRIKLGVDIHPAATIGRRFTIDHGTGVVIGSTAIIGDDCMLYQGATLGMTGKQPYGKRHPTLGNGVLVGANAVVLGDIHVGDNAKIGAGSVVVEDIPNDVTVAGVPARIVRDRRYSGFRLVDPLPSSAESENVRWSCAL